MTEQKKVTFALGKALRPEFCNISLIRQDSGAMVRIDFGYASQDTGEAVPLGAPILLTLEHAKEFVVAVTNHIDNRELAMAGVVKH